MKGFVFQRNKKKKAKKRMPVMRIIAGVLSVFLLAQSGMAGRIEPVWAGGIAENEEAVLDVTAQQTEEAKKAAAEGNPVTSEAAFLMEMESGTVIAEKNADVARPIASVTKIMTLLLILEAVDSGKIKLTDTVTVSEYAASMGGSQVFLEPGETQDVDTMLKCISISSANDACVAMAEHLAGSEAAFVEQMNVRAKELGMKNTTFLNCCGLDVAGHVSSARDVALMSAELMKNHPSVRKYTTTWMDTIIHNTRRGASEFGLANTNKLLKQYNGITGLKTGSTDEAKYCLSATAERNGINLVAVVLAAPDTKTRFWEAAGLLDYGFAKCTLYKDEGTEFTLTELPVKGGQKDTVAIKLKAPFSFVFTKGEDISRVEKKCVIPETVKAPMEEGAVLGEYQYSIDGNVIGSVPIVATENVGAMTFGSSFIKCNKLFFQELH